MKCAKITLGTLALFAAAVFAMPTPEQARAAERVVLELMREDQAALKSGAKTRAEVAESAMALAGKMESEAPRLLLMKGAYNLYVRAGEFGKAGETLKSLLAAIPDIPPASMTNIVEASFRDVPGKDGGRLLRILGDAAPLAAKPVSGSVFKNAAIGQYTFRYRLDGRGNAILEGSPCVSPKPEGELVVPDKIDGHTVTKIDNIAFAGCDKMTRIVLPPHLDDILYEWGRIHAPGAIFDGCFALESIEIAESNPKYTSENGVLYAKDKTEVLAYPKNRSEVTLARETTVVGSRAFGSCMFKTAKIPDTVERIWYWAFWNCPNLEVVELPENIKWIGVYVFDSSWKMKKVVFNGDAPAIHVRRTIGRENLFSASSGDIVVEVRKGSKGWKSEDSTELPERWPTTGSASRPIRHIR